MTSITIAIPTHNRAATLRETLASVAALSVPSGCELECLVVDNRSSDGTLKVVESLRGGSSIPIRCVREERLGSSFARNRAVDESRSDFVFFIDDDAIAEPQWASAMLAEMEARQLDVAAGLVLPRWPSEPPSWLGRSLWVKLAVHDQDGIASASQDRIEVLSNYFSANVGFRHSAFQRFGKFREDLGVVGGNPMSGEDTELFARIIAGGGRMGFARQAVVHHLIPPERLTRQYLRHKSFAFGVGSGLAGGRSHNSIDKLARNAIRMMAATARGDRERAIYHELECFNFFGYWKGRMSRRSVT